MEVVDSLTNPVDQICDHGGVAKVLHCGRQGILHISALVTDKCVRASIIVDHFPGLCGNVAVAGAFSRVALDIFTAVF